jgi:acyl-CoA reductase-like NAD-dependent aldehyde dehydrogenase
MPIRWHAWHQRVVRDAGLEDGVFQTLVIAESDVPTAVARLAGDPRIAAVTLTGSERAGAAIGAASGTARKKAVLELGGSDPSVVRDDPDVDTVVASAMRSRLGNAGQSCIAAKRFIVDRRLQPRFDQAFADAVAALRIGDPLEPATEYWSTCPC